ncbi:MAG: 4-hydroxy-tetrahydrodipicolinate reductase [Spirochaetaceae bacterium]|nr:4-hydroxy-tetrahydrodipicolinate reductase [Spirochaetaceae bacterium]
MKIILSGYGKMGRMIEGRALEKGHEVAAVVDPIVAAAGKTVSGTGAGIFGTIDDFEKQNGSTDACIAVDFSHPDVVVQNIRTFAKKKIPALVGTTGWYDKLDELAALFERNQGSLLWASNFSLGINLFYQIAAYCAALLDPYSEYDAGAYETHHNQKADSPSGTAKMIAGHVIKNMKRKTKVVWDKLDRPPEPDELHCSSLRVGAEPGIHGLVFDSAADSIEIRHTARSREGLVSGALIAAEWLDRTVKAGRHGIFTMDDVLA